MNLLKELVITDPKEAVDKVFIKKGGLFESQSAGELRRGRVQAYNMKQLCKITNCLLIVKVLPLLVHVICCIL